MFKQPFLSRSPKSQRFSALLVVLIIAVVGTVLLLGSHAATPYAAVNAHTGTLAGGATSQSCSGASDGTCVQFGTTSTGGGGTGTGGGGTNSGGGTNMVVGLNEAGWGTGGINNVASAVKYDRFDQDDGTSISGYTSAGVKVDVLFSGPYTTNGVSSMNASTWSNNALSWYQSSGCTPTECPTIEVLNEPGGTWFWGSNALSSTNTSAYANLVKTAYTTFHNAYGSSAPLVLATFDGSDGSIPQGVNLPSNEYFGYEWWSSSMSSYVDGIVVHPYGGDSDPSQSKLGNRAAVTAAHNYTGKPIYATEIGWPTATSSTVPTSSNDTGDSLQWPQSNASGAGQGDQCDNVYNFLSWSRGTNYVNAVYIFGYADYGTNDFYGMYNSSGTTAKPAFSALKAAANNQANPCPNPLSY